MLKERDIFYVIKSIGTVECLHDGVAYFGDDKRYNLDAGGS